MQSIDEKRDQKSCLIGPLLIDRHAKGCGGVQEIVGSDIVSDRASLQRRVEQLVKGGPKPLFPARGQAVEGWIT